ncbi:MAG: glycosyltransferase [Verrucomicrobium sp.]
MTELPPARILIFVVAYNAESTLASVLDRVPKELHQSNVEVLIIDDSSTDDTFGAGLRSAAVRQGFKIHILRNPVNQGYGGNQKLGYHYAIENGFDIVVLLHGDGQYAPEKMPMLLEPLIRKEADAVFGSRMIHRKDALQGGMPFYKWVGNQVLTRFQNRILGTQLSEFHSGYRLYRTDALRKIPFERNSNDFHFDTDIIVQLHFAGLKISELPIPTFYGDEICRVNGLKYAWDVCRSVVRARLHSINLLYDRKFDVGQPEFNYSLKLGFCSSHTMALGAVRPGATVLDVGCGQGDVAALMADTAAKVVGVDQYPGTSEKANITLLPWKGDSEDIPVSCGEFDQIFLLDIIEHLRDPDAFMEKLRDATGSKRPEIILTTANVAFLVTRLMLLVGNFNYGRKGILDRTHTRLFTFRSLCELLEQAGYEVVALRGIPAPWPAAFGPGWFGRMLVRLNQAAIWLSKGLFSYQMFVKARTRPSLRHVFEETVQASEVLKRQAIAPQFFSPVGADQSS